MTAQNTIGTGRTGSMRHDERKAILFGKVDNRVFQRPLDTNTAFNWR
jgi:hypothetical protein